METTSPVSSDSMRSLPRYFIEVYKAKYTAGGQTVLNKHIPYAHIHSQSLIVSLWLDHDTEVAYVESDLS